MEEFTQSESLKLIEQMIGAARNEHTEKGHGWLWWGWLLFTASAASALLVQFGWGQYVGWVWSGMSGIVLVAFAFESRTRKTKMVKTYIEELLQKFSTGFFISLLAMIGATTLVSNAGDNNGQQIAFAFGYFFILYAFWMFIQGSAIRFRPLVVGAAVNWLAAIAIFIVKDFKYAMIISAVAIAAGYLVPGYILRYRYNKTHKK